MTATAKPMKLDEAALKKAIGAYWLGGTHGHATASAIETYLTASGLSWLLEEAARVLEFYAKGTDNGHVAHAWESSERGFDYGARSDREIRMGTKARALLAKLKEAGHVG